MWNDAEYNPASDPIASCNRLPGDKEATGLEPVTSAVTEHLMAVTY